MINKKTFLSLGIIGTIAMPIGFVVSCSSSSNEEVKESSFLNNYYDHIWGNYDESENAYENKVSSFLINQKNTIAKTEQEVLEIATNKLNNVTENELREFLLNTAVKGSSFNEIKRTDTVLKVDIIDSNKNLLDIQNVKFNKEEKTVSFDYLLKLVTQTEFNGTKVLMEIKSAFRYRNIILEPSVFKIASTNVIMPTFIFSNKNDQEVNPNSKASIELISYSIDKKGVNKFVDAVYENIHSTQPNITKELIKTTIEQMATLFEQIFKEVKKLGATLGRVNDKFKFVSFINENLDPLNILKSMLISGDELGYIFNEENPSQVTTQGAGYSSPILFIKNFKSETASVEWEAYEIKTI